jgi:BirA family biotin operon repressor/biotin-[acetyl-CoA-carboxylase] ligase
MDEGALAVRLHVPRVVTFAHVTSTMDEAHQLAAAGCDAGTLVIADEQTAGRGRGGKRWTSAPARGIWMTLIERPESESGLDVLSLRLGLAGAQVLDGFADARVMVKWPNDLYVGSGKLAGILVEARWRDRRPDWVAIGVGVNIDPPADVPGAAGLRAGTARDDVLGVLVPALRGAAAVRGRLGVPELAAFASRDYALGRACSSPIHGHVRGITGDGALMIESNGEVAHFRGGSLELSGEAP